MLSWWVLGLALAAPEPYRGPIPIIAYHEIGGEAPWPGGPRYDAGGLNISVATFRAQIELMWTKGYWPVNLRDVARKQPGVPSGKRPVVLTFDDGRATQFRYLPHDRLDPNCAVGVLADFHHRHPSWPMRGTFFLIAGSDKNGVPFDQEGSERRKVRQLLRWGFEIGNHTLTHPSFHKLNARQIVNEVAGCDAYLKHLVPGIRVDTIAMPYGHLPDDPKLWPLLRHSARTREGYRNIGVALFDVGVCPPPYSAEFDPFRIPRLAPRPGALEALLRGAESKGESLMSPAEGTSQPRPHRVQARVDRSRMDPRAARSAGSAPFR